MNASKIEWTDVTWNPVRGCSMVSDGCTHCYAMKQAHRFSGPGQAYAGMTTASGPNAPHWSGDIKLVPELLDAPLHWRKPRRIFVNSMSDLFHEDVPDEFIAKVFGTMFRSPRHTFQILTKRPERMMKWFARCGNAGKFGWITHDNTPPAKAYRGTGIIFSQADRWPLPNVWIGVSVENQQTADERIPLLLQTPAAVRWISVEPLLGPMDINTWLSWPKSFEEMMSPRPYWNISLDWVVVGGESGPGSRPCNVEWIRSIVAQSRAAGVPVFVKQFGRRSYATEGSREAKEWSADGATAIMDDVGQIHCRDRKGGDPSEWPESLRVREWPKK